MLLTSDMTAGPDHGNKESLQLAHHFAHQNKDTVNTCTKTVHDCNNKSPHVNYALAMSILTSEACGEFGVPLTRLRFSNDWHEKLRFQVLALPPDEHFTTSVGFSL